MDVKQFAAVFVASLAAGSLLYAGASADIPNPLEKLEFGEKPESGNRSEEPEVQEFVPGTAHEHALFYVAVDGERLEFLEKRSQLAARHVHLENGRSEIVHKHAEGVRWEDFFQTIDLEVNRTGGEVCLDVKNVSRCGEGEVWLNGKNASLDSEIQQGDRFYIVLGDRWKEELALLRDERLPPAYTSRADRGRPV
jgi:hypothetical protein